MPMQLGAPGTAFLSATFFILALSTSGISHADSIVEQEHDDPRPVTVYKSPDCGGSSAAYARISVDKITYMEKK